jgi:hypothetical protein
MATKHRAHDEDAWRNAKQVCRLNERQVEMARALGMNPRKLPGLRPSPQQRWKLPVGEFIVECYRKRFGGDRLDHHPHVPDPGSRKPSPPQRDTQAPERVRDAALLAGDLVCYLTNLADDLQRWIAHGTFDPEVLPQVSEELREIAQALDTGAPISSVPAIPVSRRPTREAFSRRDNQEPEFGDDEIPFYDDEIPF